MLLCLNSPVFLLAMNSDLSLNEGEMTEPLPGENGGYKYNVV